MFRQSAFLAPHYPRLTTSNTAAGGRIMLAERPQTCNIDSTEQLRLTLCLCQTDTILGIVWAESEQTVRIDCVTKIRPRWRQIQTVTSQDHEKLILVASRYYEIKLCSRFYLRSKIQIQTSELLLQAFSFYRY